MTKKGTNTGVSVNTALKNNAIITYNGMESLQAHLFNGLSKLEESFINNDLKISYGKNDKLMLPDISLPSEVLRVNFLITVDNNKSLLEMESVKILYNYFLNNKMCVNCEGCYNSCYVSNGLTQYKEMGIAYLRNLLIFITNKEGFKNDILEYTSIYNIFRYNTSGDIFHREYLELIIEIANTNKFTTYYLYTKNFELIEEYLKMGLIPANLVINLSLYGSYHKDKIESLYNEYNVNIYKVVAESENIEESEIMKKCKSIGKEMNCSKCRHCADKSKLVITNYVHGAKKGNFKNEVI